ncbi:hypothetical protein QO009_003022 [Brevibacillus aydinogluensis]|uniref:hypothetical protein n=1 Tax=Brevibacillus aydinogluensis TaxID=927786 RepID=UPI0028938316|nr:hypothetical protein [Brevibacillus aydinogluensis]MDT3417127.1 hypothetical protein [Brevibacillus aydinogluensis]
MDFDKILDNFVIGFLSLFALIVVGNIAFGIYLVLTDYWFQALCVIGIALLIYIVGFLVNKFFGKYIGR